MNIKELEDMLVSSFESNRNKYIPWWDGDHNNSDYYYNIFNDEEIKAVNECITACERKEILEPVGSMGVTLFHLLVWHNFYDEVKYLIDAYDDKNDLVNARGQLGKGILKDVCVGVTPLMLACYQGNVLMVKLLIEAGADVLAVDEKRRNVYHYLLSYINKLQKDYTCSNNSLLLRKEIAGLLGDGVSLSDNDGKTPLEYMLESDNSNISWALAKAYIEKGAKLDVTNAEGDNLLIQAIKNNHITATLELACKEELINQKNNEGKTALHYAVYNERLELCMALMERKADKNIQDNEGISPLDMVEEYHNEELEKYIKTKRIDLGNLSRLTSNAFARVSESTRDNLSLALYLTKKLINEVDEDDDDEMNKIVRIMNNALMSDEECNVLSICKKAGINFTQPICSSGVVTCLRDECVAGNYGINVIKKLIDMGIDMDEAVIKGRTPINIIASKEARQMFGRKKDDYFERSVEFFLVESMEQLDNNGTSALHYAAKRNHADMIRAMVKKGVNVNITEDEPSNAGDTPLHSACDNGSREAVKALMEAGADDTMLNVKGITPAHLAVTDKGFGKRIQEEDRIAMLEALKNIDIPASDGKTPLMVAQQQSLDINTALSITQHLIDREADVNHVDNDGNTALILNTKNNCYKGTVKELIKAGADVNLYDKQGNSALYYALKNGDQESARFMIKKGADFNHENNQGVTPLQVAVEKGYDNVLELMM